MERPTLALFFGAGAEMSYGLPSGGKFALEIFRMDVSGDKNDFNEKRKMVAEGSIYASHWLPLGYLKKPVSAFGKSHLESLVKGSLENKRDVILNYLNDFDRNVKGHANSFSERGNKVKESFENITHIKFGSKLYTQLIALSTSLGDYNKIFGSSYFSALLNILETSGISKQFRVEVKKIVKAVLELLIGSCGEALIHRLNDGVFAKTPPGIDVFDEFESIFSLDYRRTGLEGLDYIVSESFINFPTGSDENIIIQFGKMILEDLYAKALDYQSLIDSYWRYLYSPKTDWAKFCKIAIFLHTVRRYIYEIAKKYIERCKAGPGYYHDVLEDKFLFDIKTIGTTNYNTFIEEVTKRDVFFLNGSVRDFYDPYLNKIVKVEKLTKGDHITVPFLFTQSGIKPLTSVRMSERYVKLYDEFRKSDVICVIGYGFNTDDGHINGMFRSLIEDENKQIFIFHYTGEHKGLDTDELMIEYRNKLRLELEEGINIIGVDKERKSVPEGLIWYEALSEAHNKIKNK